MSGNIRFFLLSSSLHSLVLLLGVEMIAGFFRRETETEALLILHQKERKRFKSIQSEQDGVYIG